MTVKLIQGEGKWKIEDKKLVEKDFVVLGMNKKVKWNYLPLKRKINYYLNEIENIFYIYDNKLILKPVEEKTWKIF